MKVLRLLICILCFGALATASKAQELHYTLYNMSPLTLNPAQTGAFYGTVRVGGIFRSQWYAVDDNLGYETPGFYVDAPIIRGFREQDWVGIGGAIVNDRAGELGLRTVATMLSASYHLGLDDKGKSVLTLGLQGGSTSRSFFTSRVKSEGSFDSQTGTFDIMQVSDNLLSSGGSGGQNDNTSTDWLEFGAGLMFKMKNDDDDGGLEVGLAVDNVTGARSGFDTGGNKDRKPLRIAAHTRYEWALTDRWSAAPTAFAQFQSGATEVAVQTWAGYLFNQEKDITLNFGLGYRVGDAPNVLFGVDVKDLRVAASFDINTSQYRTATDYQGGFEIAAWYIIKKYKKPEIKPAILCPRF
jgi:type IX secretion system PorP/SprF family membrane protein